MEPGRGDDSPPELEVTTLGGLEIRWRGDRVGAELPDKAQAVLAYLADSNRVVSRSEVAGLLWSDLPEERARANLRLALTKIRRVLPGAMGANRRSLWLDVPVECDATRIEQGAVAEPVRPYGGEFLAGFDVGDAELFDDWLRARRQRLRSTALLDLAAAAGAATAAGEWSTVIDVAGRVLEIEPWNEEAHRQMMEALANTSGRAAALAQFDHCERLLQDELGLGPEPETLALATKIDEGIERGAAPHAVRIPGLPSVLTPFLARDEDVTMIMDRLTGGTERLVTLVGPGGVGKTRLSIEAAERARDSFELAAFASLAGVRSSAEAVSVVAGLAVPGGAGGVEPLEDLVSSIGERRALIVLDNLEHLADEIGPIVVQVLERCPRAVVLATSRQALDVAIEDVVDVRGLPVPTDGGGPIDSFGAARLFVDRAYRIDKSFSLGADNEADVARLCQLVEGMPLHLELAASRVRNFTVAEIVDALAADAALPGSARSDVAPRHASFAAVFGQSWDLLDRSDQRALARLAVTRGGFDRRAAEVLAASPIAAGALARRSLLHEERGGRYRFHELVRQAAAAHLDEEERAEAEVAHATYFLGVLAAVASDLASWEALEVATRLLPDLDNVRAAWTRGVRLGMAAELGLAVDGLCRLFDVAGLGAELAALLGDTAQEFSDGRLTPVGDFDEAALLVRQAEQLAPLVNDLSADELCDRALDLLEGRPRRAADRCWALIHRARSCILRHEGECAAAHLRAALDEATAAGDTRAGGWIAALRGRIETNSGRFEQATALLEDALQVFVEIDDPIGQSAVHSYLAPAYAEQYLIWQALESDRRALSLAESLGQTQRLADLNSNVGASLVLFGDFDAAREFTQTAIDLARSAGEDFMEGYVLVQYAQCVADAEEAEALMSRGIALEREWNDEYGLLYSLVPWSRLLLRIGRFEEAKLATEELVEVAGSRDAPHFAVTARVIGARADAAAGRHEAALDEVLRCWELIDAGSIRLPWAIDTRLDIVEVAGPEHPVGAAALAQATEIHRATARSIADPVLRRMFLEGTEVSRTLAAHTR